MIKFYITCMEAGSSGSTISWTALRATFVYYFFDVRNIQNCCVNVDFVKEKNVCLTILHCFDFHFFYHPLVHHKEEAADNSAEFLFGLHAIFDFD